MTSSDFIDGDIRKNCVKCGIIKSGTHIPIKYYGVAAREVKITLSDIDGRLIKTVVEKLPEESGIYRAKIKTGGLKSGVYYIVYQSSMGDRIRRKILITR